MGYDEEAARSSFRRGTAIAIDSQPRFGQVIAKTEEEVALKFMTQLKNRGHPKPPPALATDGKRIYREAISVTWGHIPAYPERDRPPMQKQPSPDWHPPR